MSEQIRKQVKYEFCGNIVISFSKWDPLPNVLSNHQLSFCSFFPFFLLFMFYFSVSSFLSFFFSSSLIRSLFLFFLSSSLRANCSLSSFLSFFALSSSPNFFQPVPLLILSKSKPQGWSLQVPLSTISISFLFFFTYGRKSLSLLLVICGFRDSVDWDLRIYKMKFWFGYLRVYVGMFMRFVSMGSDLAICGFMIVCLWDLCPWVLIWLLWVYVCCFYPSFVFGGGFFLLPKISMFMSWVRGFGLASFFWCMG